MEQYKIGGEPENSDTVYNEVVYITLVTTEF